MSRVLWLAGLVLLCACAKAPPDAPVFVLPEDCASLHVLLPENYIIELESGSEVFLNPSAYEFMVFCNRADAAKARKNAYQEGLFAANSQWRIYVLEGDPGQLARYCANGKLCLGQPSQVIEWIDEENGPLE